MARHSPCRRGRHDWQEFETTEGAKGRRCDRCGEVIWLDRESESHRYQNKDRKSYAMPWVPFF